MLCCTTDHTQSAGVLDSQGMLGPSLSIHNVRVLHASRLLRCWGPARSILMMLFVNSVCFVVILAQALIASFVHSRPPITTTAVGALPTLELAIHPSTPQRGESAGDGILGATRAWTAGWRWGEAALTRCTSMPQHSSPRTFVACVSCSKWHRQSGHTHTIAMLAKAESG